MLRDNESIEKIMKYSKLTKEEILELEKISGLDISVVVTKIVKKK